MMDLLGIELSDILIFLLVFFVVLLIIRELVTWYWKINKIVQNQETQNTLLKDILDEIKKK